MLPDACSGSALVTAPTKASSRFSPWKSSRWRSALFFGGEVLLVCALALNQGNCTPAQNKGTIGAVLAQSPDGRITLREVPPELAAGKAGLQAGDELLLIDGIDVRQLDAKTIHRLLSGEVDQPIDLTLQRGDEVIRVTLKRSAVPRATGAPKQAGADNPLTNAEPAP